MRLKGRLFATAHMPNSQDFDCFWCDAVVNEVTNATYQQTADTLSLGTHIGGADARLLCQ